MKPFTLVHPPTLAEAARPSTPANSELKRAAWTSSTA